MKKIKFALFIVFLGLIQVVFLEYFKIFGVRSDLLLICAVIASFIFEFRSAFILAVLLGLIKDSFSGSPFGINTLLFSLWCFLIFKLSRQISMENNVIRLILMLVIAVLHNIISGLVLIYLGRAIPLGIFIKTIVFSSIFAALIFPWLYRISIKIK